MNVASSDSGVYTCVDNGGFGPNSISVKLIVIENDPECSIDLQEINYIRRHVSCDELTVEVVTATCAVQYHGINKPYIEWKMSSGTHLKHRPTFQKNNGTDNQIATSTVSLKMHEIEKDVLTCEVLPKLEMGHVIDEPSIFKCQIVPPRTVATVTKVADHISCDYTTLRCSPCANSIWCTYRWIDRRDNGTVSLGPILDLTSYKGDSYSLQCIITCNMPNLEGLLAVEADIVTCIEQTEKDQIVYIGIYVIVGIFIGVMSFFIFSRKHRGKAIYRKMFLNLKKRIPALRQHSEIVNEYTQLLSWLSVGAIVSLPTEIRERILLKATMCFFKDPSRATSNERTSKQAGIIICLGTVCKSWQKCVFRQAFMRQTIRLSQLIQKPYRRNQTLITRLSTDGYPVTGIVEFVGKIFIVCAQNPALLLYNARAPFMRLKNIAVPNMRHPVDVIGCHANNCVYVLDNLVNCIWRVNTNKPAPSVNIWMDLECCSTISLTTSGNILILIRNEIYIYSAECEIIDKIHIPSKLVLPHRVIEVDRDTFIISHSDSSALHRHRMCQMKRDGRIVWSWGNRDSMGIQGFHWPVSMSLDKQGKLVVFDVTNSKLLLFKYKPESSIYTSKPSTLLSNLRKGTNKASCSNCEMESGNVLIGTLFTGVDVCRIKELADNN